jgi:hypothetical protein
MAENNLTSFVKRYKITATAKPSKSNPNMPDSDGMDNWSVKLTRLVDGEKRSMNVPFSMGKGHNGKTPTAADVLDCLASDAAGVENATSFDDWASDYGYDTDSRKAERIYKACKRNAEDLYSLLGGEAYNELLWETERL